MQDALCPSSVSPPHCPHVEGGDAEWGLWDSSPMHLSALPSQDCSTWPELLGTSPSHWGAPLVGQRAEVWSLSMEGPTGPLDCLGVPLHAPPRPPHHVPSLTAPMPTPLPLVKPLIPGCLINDDLSGCSWQLFFLHSMVSYTH